MGNEQSKDKVLTMKGNSPEKHENGTVNGLSANITSNGLEIDVNGETTVQQNGGPLSLNLAIESTEPNCVTVESDCNHADDPIISEIPETTVQEVVEEVKKSKEGKVKVFGKMFKKKTEPPADVKSVNKTETSNEDQTDVSLPATDPQPETANLKQESESLTASESVTLDPGPEEGKAPETDSQPVENQEDSNPEENPVMNFFKTLVTPTKTTKKETATPDATKDQSQKENQPAATTTVAQVSEPPAAPKGMSIPPPPPPEPPKMEIKGEPAAKPVKPTPKEEPKAAAKEPESSKGKSAKNTLSKFFRPKVLLGVKASKGKGASASGANAPTKTAAVTIKEAPQSAVEETPVEVPEPVVEVQSENNVEPHETAEEVAQPVVEEQKVDPSKASTLEASAKPEPPPPVQEEKKTASKSPFLSFFKPKAADPKKATPAPAAAAEAAQTVKAKEEPKVAAKSSEAAVDNKPASAASQAGDDAASVPRKLEKRNSIHLFFKNLGQKRNSTDAGVQTEPVTVAPAAEKAK
ncbi:breast carcinoma-amplified sequence 1 isoform X14 [Siniperca chuatsi]|uniref:breast carcinoma-amplified sequence 1 isoform X14 n=1 Tax=Siniperca chuatsi TaxID=119488 RepID=UPI001CE17A7D|nr:breast carcinoma-amplified sequence 1 isoform X14 [Siniperca chuatsi]